MTEITLNPMEEAAERGLVLDPSVHKLLPDGLFLGAVKRAARRKDLFLYFHRRTRKFVLAVWMRPPSSHAPRVAIELEALDWHPDTGCIDPVEFGQRLRLTLDSQVRHMKTKLLRAATEKRQSREQDLAQRNEVTKYLKNRGYELEAHLIKTGQMPWVGLRGGGERLEMVKDQLKDMVFTQNRITRSLS